MSDALTIVEAMDIAKNMGATSLAAAIVALHAENTTLREITEAVATIKWNLNEDWCLFCGSTLWQDEPENHTPTCPVTRARELLSTPPLV